VSDEHTTSHMAGLIAPDVSHGVGGVLRIAAFRRLWLALSFSSLGDWLGLLATTALAQQLAAKHGAGFAVQQYAIGGVLIVRFLPALLLGPLAGALADHVDRRTTMVVCDFLRFALLLLIPLTHSLAYLIAASFLIEVVTLFWAPAKEATVPNLVPPDRLERANQLSLLTTYGSAPVAAAIFALLAVMNRALEEASSFFTANPTDLALYFDAATFLGSALTIWSLREIKSARTAEGEPQRAESFAGLMRSIVEGWRFVGQTPLVRGLVIGMLGAFASAGAVIALGKGYTTLHEGGNAAYGVLFGAVFAGLAAGMAVGPRLLYGFSRRRLFGLSIIGAGAALAVLALVPDLVLALLMAVVLGAFSGLAWVTGYTLLGAHVSDDVRGRTFSFVGSLVRMDLLVVLAVAPFLSGAIGDNTWDLGSWHFRSDGITLTLFGAGLLAMAVGRLAYKQMDDSSIPLLRELWSALRGHGTRGKHPGLFIAFEGGDGAGKSTQVRLLAEWLRAQGADVLTTREPGGTSTGRSIRALLLDPSTSLTPRAEALLYAADRADHVASLVDPALRAGSVVITDRYVDSSLAYQGAGRELARDEVRRLSTWATGGLVPDLTVVLDLPADVGLRRAGGTPDRLEAEPLAFHERVREGFLALADRDPGRYLVVDAELPPEQVAAAVRVRVAPLLSRIVLSALAESR
jgi:dTMP kinase